MSEKKYTVLLVDDDKFLLDMYSVKFKEHGLQVLVSYGGEDALKQLREGAKPDAIVLDMVMPGITGTELLETVEKEKLGGGMVRIVLSNQGQESDIEAAKKLGADGYIVKANSVPSEVLDKVINIIENKSEK